MQTTKFSSQLNGYLIGKTIGRGTFGKVKKAIHKLTDEPVAIKFLQKQKIKDISDVQRVSRQLHFLKIVRHPAIAQMYQIIQTPQMIYIVMEYAAGGEYFDYVMDDKIKNQAEAFHYFSQILEALIYLHKLKISHRDVKPENMLLDSQKRIKLVDFGLSNLYRQNEKLSTACGSPCYASPQMIKGQDYDPELTDVWSLGIVLYTSVMARLPFEDQNTNILYNKIKSGFYRISKKISPELKDLLSKMINVKPQQRLRLKQICQHDWYKKYNTDKEISGIEIGFENIPVDKSIVEQMEVFGFDSKKTVKYIENNVKNQCTATYYLFLKKNFKSGKASAMDICAEGFNKSNITPFFKIKPKRFKSIDQSKLFENQKTSNQQRFLNQRNCNSLIKYDYVSMNKKRQNSLSLKKYSMKSNSRQQIKVDYKKKIQNFIKTKAQRQVKQRLFQKTMITRKSLSISTQKVRKSSKKIDERTQQSLQKTKMKIISNQQKLHKRHKTDYLAEIYCPSRKRQLKKVNEVSKQKGKRFELDADIEIYSFKGNHAGSFWKCVENEQEEYMWGCLMKYEWPQYKQFDHIPDKWELEWMQYDYSFSF